MKGFKKLQKMLSKKTKYLIFALAAIVLFVTVYALLLPAVALESDQATEETAGIVLDENTDAAAGEAAADINEESMPAAEPELEAEAPVPETVQEAETTPSETTTTPETTTPETTTAETDEETSSDMPQMTFEAKLVKEGTTARADGAYGVAVNSQPLTEAQKKEILIQVKAEAFEGTFPAGTTMKIKDVSRETAVSKAVQTAVPGKAGVVQAVDISFFDKDGKEIEPKKEIKVTITSNTIKDAKKEQDQAPVIVHIPNRGTAEVVKQMDEKQLPEKPAEDELIFQSSSFSVYAVVESTIEKNILASDGYNYKITVTYGEEAGIPEGAGLQVEEISGEAYDDYLAKTAEMMNADRFAFARIFDISIIDANGVHVTPSAPVDVKAELADASSDNNAEFAVIHFSGEEEQPEQMNAATSGNVVSFSTESFSAYAIVQGPDADSMGWTQIRTMNDLQSYLQEGIYIGTTGGFYMQNYTAPGSADAGTTGIVKTKPAQTRPPLDTAALYYFEPVAGTTNQFYIYCFDDSGENELYVRNTGDANLYLTEDASQATAWTVQVDNQGRFRFNNGNRYWNMWNGANANHIAAWTTATDGNNYFYIFYHTEVTDDPYELDGRSYGLMNWEEGTVGKAMMSEENGNNLKALSLTVMAKKNNNNDKLFVPADSDITMWTFHWDHDDFYYVTTIIDGVEKYLKIENGKLSVVSEEDAEPLQILPGSGTHAGEICLKSQSGATLTYSGNYGSGFNTNGSVGAEWLHFVDLSEETADYFMTHSADKVSVSDPSITNGSSIIVYTRSWNDEKKEYEFYAIDHDGTLVRCYESGDTIQWVGHRVNNLLWNFVEYYWEGTTDPNYYYDLYNPYSEKYISPQITGEQILSDEPIGLNLNGRRNGQYYSSILAWDDPNYAYAGLKVVDGHIVSCPINEAMDFYFAIMEDIPVDDELLTVLTVDHVKNGVTMKLVDFGTRAEMTNFLGSDDQYKNGNTESGLLSTNLGEDGYPITNANNSLSSWFSGAQEVNHLFIASTYNGTGYYEYDSTQNFAHYDDESKNFVVYEEIGTTDSGSTQWYKHGQFFPFNDITAGRFSAANPRNTTAATGENLPNDDPRKNERLYLINGSGANYYMGVEIEASFTQTPNGLDDWGHDIIYEFTGDDDFWLYVDGELIIDLGGIHDALPGSVNYRTGDVYVNGKHYTLRELFESNFRGRNPEASDAEVNEYLNNYFEPGSTIFKDYSSHTMKIFYLERGAGASNLHMRFNLASIKPGTVELTKAVSGVDSSETVLAEFPYQIIYKLEGSDTEHLLEQGDALNRTVVYKNTTTLVPFRDSVEIGGVTYQDVFLLKPGETCEINFPENTASYRIVECGVNTDVYNKVTANGTVLPGTQEAGYQENRKDYGMEYASPIDRARVTYDNEVRPDALRDLTFKKRLFDETGEHTAEHEIFDDTTTFSFRLYMATEFDGAIDESPANMQTYHVKDPDGYYCRWDAANQQFARITDRTQDFTELTDEEKAQARFTTSMNGSISRIPIGYTIEVRTVLVGTQYKIVERPWEIPDGYSFQQYILNGVESDNPAEDGIGETVVAGEHPHVDICNLKGWGLRVNKVWSDEEYMEDRAPTYFAVYADHGDGNLQLVQYPATGGNTIVRELKYGENSVYWFFLPLPYPYSEVPFNNYVIREVELTDPVVDADGIVTSYSTITPIDQGGDLRIDGRQKGETSDSPFTYKVTYEQGQISENSNVREDTTTNSRPGIILKKTDWSGNALEGAIFTLKAEDGTELGPFTSGADGIITEAFLRDNIDYTLAEAKAPQGYHGLEEQMTIRQVNEEGVISYSITYEDEDYYDLDTTGDQTTLTIKNRPFALQVVKMGEDYDGTKTILPGVRFELHKEVTVSGETGMELDPLAGYTNLVSAAGTGIVPKVNEELIPRTYYLKESATPSGYLKMDPPIRFTISDNGKVTLTNHALAELSSEIDETSGKLTYTITVTNVKANARLRLIKVDQEGNPLENVQFRIEGRGIQTKDCTSKIPEQGTEAVIYDDIVPLGTYTLTERATPAGYYALEGPVTITVAAAEHDPEVLVSASMNGHAFVNPTEIYQDPETGIWTIKITNKNGYELPETGGIGTHWFYIAGGILLLGAAVLFLLKRYRNYR